MNGIRVPILVLLLSVCRAETLPVVRGNVESDSSLIGNTLVVELVEGDQNGMRVHSSVASDGSFTFRNVSNGRYTLRVTTFQGATICEQFVDLNFGGPLTVRLPERRQARPVSGVVSIQRLQKPIPDKALRAFTDGMGESSKGRPLEAARKLEQAIRLFPDYFEAHCNLGVQYVRLGRTEEALDEFEKAAAAGPPSAVVYGNIAYLHFGRNRLPEAEEAARRAISIDSKVPLPHYLLGTILAVAGKDSEAIRHLRLGASVSPKAHMVAATIYQKTGNSNGAVEELRLYLGTSDTTFRNDAERRLAALTQPNSN